MTLTGQCVARRQAADLVPLLADRGIHLSREQVFRLVTTTPQRLSLDTLASLCHLGIGLGDLDELVDADIQDVAATSYAERRYVCRPVGLLDRPRRLKR